MEKYFAPNGIPLVPLADNDTEDTRIAKYETLRTQGFQQVHFIRNCTPIAMLLELSKPTVFRNVNCNYFISQARSTTNCFSTQIGNTELSWNKVDIHKKGKLICSKCFLYGNITTNCAKHQSLKRIRDCECGKHRASFGLPSEKRARWCTSCPSKLPDAVDVRHKRCECGKSNPTFGFTHEKKPRWCKACPSKSPNAVGMCNKKCECGKSRPCYGLPCESRPRWCVACPEKLPNAINIRDKKCECGKRRPTFGLVDEKRLRWCKYCPQKPPHAKDLKTKICECGKAQPNFGLRGEKRARWCALCPEKSPHAINVRITRCECRKSSARFGLPGENARWCAVCPQKLLDAIDIYRKRCECGKSAPYFGQPHDKRATWCASCPNKLPNAVDIISKRCECGKAQASLGAPGEKKLRWCKACPKKSVDAFDVTRTRCGCGKFRAKYGLPGHSATCCFKCKLPGMCFYPMRKCSNCKSLATHGTIERKRCETHAKEGDVNLVERPCSSCGLSEVLNSNLRCNNCEPSIYKKYTKRKETHIRDVLIANGIEFKQDQIPNGTQCGKERPDFEIECKNQDGVLTHYILLEVDEDQHKSYPCECEQRRMINITQTYGGVPIFWIRYNPDAFRLPNALKGTISENKREGHLLEWIRWSMHHSPKNLAEVLHLFYDGCEELVGEKDIRILIEGINMT